MNYEPLDYKSARRLAAKSLLILIFVQILISVMFVIYFYCISNQLSENIYIHHTLPYKQALSEYDNVANKIEENIIILRKEELLNKFIYQSLLGYVSSGILWYLIFKIVGTKADRVRPKLDKSILQFYRLCWYCRLMYMIFPIGLIQTLRFFEIIRIGLGVSTADTTILSWYSRSIVFFVLFPIGIIAHTVAWRKLNIPVFW